METKKVLITVKTYPIPSAKYDELVCTGGVEEDGSFVRLYPINFRDLPYSQQYRKYQWIELRAEKHKRDTRKESYRPDCSTIQTLGERIEPKRGDWSERAKYVMQQKARSMEELADRKDADRTSLGIFQPKEIHDLFISEDEPEWKASFKSALMQARLWDDRKVTKEPPRKVPFKFHYRFACDDPRCKGKHQMMIEDWEVGAYYWRVRDDGADPLEAARATRNRFLNEVCAADKDSHFYVGTVSNHPNSWIIIGVWWPKRVVQKPTWQTTLALFDEEIAA